MAGKSKQKSKRVLKQARGDGTGDESGETDDLLYTPKETEPSGYNNPAKRMGSDHSIEKVIQTYTGNAPQHIKPSKVNYDQYAQHFPGVSLEGIN